MPLNNNPLKQYFRRPSIYLKLPSGGKYPPNILNMPESGELPVYPMTAIDEITSKTPDALYNGTAMTDIIKSCIPNIIDPWLISSVDLDAILIAIKAASGGNDLEIESTCPSCSESSKYGINLLLLLTTLTAANYENTMEINELHIKFKSLTYKELNQTKISQFEVQRILAGLESNTNTDDTIRIEKTQLAIKSIVELTIALISNSIEYVETPNSKVTDKEFIMDYLTNCDKQSYIAIRDFNTKLKAEAEIKPLAIKCIKCGHEYSQPFTLNITDFFA